MATATARRAGFTLIELLVVMALLAVLAAIAAGVYFRVRSGAELTATQSTLDKLNAGIDRKWKAVLDAARKEAPNTPAGFKTTCGNDPERILIVLSYMKLKNEFPTTVAEATNPVSFGGLTLQPRSIFTGLSATGTPEEQSAACLYVSLTQGGVGGETFDATPLQSQTRAVAGNQVFVDSWGKPIAFVRQAYCAEVNSPPYTRSASGKDPVDTVGKLGGLGANLTPFWTAIRTNQMNLAAIPATYDANQNWVPTVVSGGPNEKFGALLGGNDDGNDNLISFRLRKAGAKGN